MIIFSSYLEGCMSRVVVNSRVQDFAESEKQNKVVPGCGDAEQRDQEVGKSANPKVSPTQRNNRRNGTKSVCPGHV